MANTTHSTHSSAASSGHRSMPPPPPSHASFILAQIRSGLAHLHASQALDKDTFHQVNQLLSKAVLKETETISTSSTLAKVETEEEKLGKRNAWLRETLIETSLLPNLVDTAMQIAIPSAVMGSAQREAVVLLVSRSQKAIVDSVTNPNNQKKAGSGAWSGIRGTQAGIVKGWNVAGNSIQEIAQKRQEAREKSEEKKAAKREKKAMKKELKEERERIIRQRQTEMLNEGGDDTTSQDQLTSSQKGMDRLTSTKNLVHSPTNLTVASDGSSPAHRLPPSLTIGTEMQGSDDNDSSSDDDTDEEDAFYAEDGAMASVSCGRIGEHENGVTATTTFSPWPGLLLSNTIVALSQDQLPKGIDIERIKYDQAVGMEKKQSTSSVPPPRRVAPPTSSMSQQASTSQGSNPPATNTQTVSTQSRFDQTSKQELPPIPPSHTNPPQRSPAPPLPQHPSSSHANPPSYTAPLPRASEQPRTQPYQPSSSHNGGTFAHQPPQMPEVRDVTESKQKSWTRKLGL